MTTTVREDQSRTQRKNVIINGNFEIWQRGFTHTGISAAQYTADRWILQITSQGTWTARQVVDGPTPQLQHCAECVVTAADPAVNATDVAEFVQLVEGFNILPLYQVPFVISFWVKSNVTGQYYFAIDNGTDRSYVIPYTINAANTWEYKTLFVTSSPVGGTWNFTNGMGMSFRWVLALGSNFHTTTFNQWFNLGGPDSGLDQVNLAAAINNYWRITGVQVERGSTVALSDARPFSEELALCQRYYETGSNFEGDALSPPGLASGHEVYSTATFKVTKRTTPTVVNSGFVAGGGGFVGSTFAGFGASTLDGFMWTIVHLVEDAGGTLNWTADAEL